MTEPAGTVRLDAVVTAPTLRFAPVIAVVAAACVRPTTLGTATCGGPDDTTSAAALPLSSVVTAPTMRFAPVIAVVAAACVAPTTLGTATFGGVDARISIAARFH